MSIPKDLIRENQELSNWCIMSCYRGSISHGMYVPNSNPNSIDDKDAMVICIPPLDYYMGLKEYGSKGTREIKRDEWDIVVYEFKKMISLLSKGNPNVLMALFLEPNHYMVKKDAWNVIIEHRDFFVGKHVYRSFIGYAHSQLHRMTHYKFEGYMGKKRKALVDKFGYDTKNASHLIRLLRMGIEFLTDGVLYVKRHDAQQLLEIKKGEWTLEQVKVEAAKLFEHAELAFINSKLPANIDKEKINKLCVRVIMGEFYDRGYL